MALQSRPQDLPAKSRWTRLGEVVAALSIGLLIAFHALLLWQRVSSLSLLEPTVALRWLATPLLLLLLERLRRSGVPLLWGRKAVVFWLLVLLLHVSFTAPAGEEVAQRIEPRAGTGLLLALPATFAAAILCLLARVFRHRRAATRRADQSLLRLVARLAGPPARASTGSGWLAAVGCRAPPA